MKLRNLDIITFTSDVILSAVKKGRAVGTSCLVNLEIDLLYTNHIFASKHCQVSTPKYRKVG